MTSSILAARTTSAFPLSIGTSLSFESLSQLGGKPYDPDRKIPQHVELKNYQEFWINLSTLFRNMYSSVPSQEAVKLQAGDCADVLLEEMEVIEDTVKQETAGQMRVVFFISNYKNIKNMNSQAIPRVPNTQKQIDYFKLHDKTIQQVLNTRYQRQEDISIFENKIKPKEPCKALIFTHIAYDLLGYPKFTKLDLIESHTGVLKQRNMWYTKLYQSDDLQVIPFIEIMLKFFGDSHTFRPFPIKARKTILEVAIEKRWTWATTEAKVKQDLGYMKDQYLAQVINSL